MCKELEKLHKGIICLFLSLIINLPSIHHSYPYKDSNVHLSVVYGEQGLLAKNGREVDIFLMLLPLAIDNDHLLL